MNDLEHFTRDAEAQIKAANHRADDLQEALSAANQRADEADKRAVVLLAEIQRLRELLAAGDDCGAWMRGAVAEKRGRADGAAQNAGKVRRWLARIARGRTAIRIFNLNQ